MVHVLGGSLELAAAFGVDAGFAWAEENRVGNDGGGVKGLGGQDGDGDDALAPRIDAVGVAARLDVDLNFKPNLTGITNAVAVAIGLIGVGD